ncbi:MAG: DUF3667 domain-containing protein, partial [Planctomycetes bacterium]|nr:DUF3667 domain-containing protein [Planctomycetota bacterium]
MSGSSLCASCGAERLGRFCSACGERSLEPGDLKLRKMFSDWLDSSFHLDGKLLLTARKLLFAPGFLTAEWIAGRRTRYSKPFAIFIVVNVLFFLIQPHTGLFSYGLTGFVGARDSTRTSYERRLVDEHLATSGESWDTYEAHFDATLQKHRKSLFLVMIPLIGGALVLLHRGKRRAYAEHLVFSIHLFAFFLFGLVLLVIPAYLLLGALLERLG